MSDTWHKNKKNKNREDIIIAGRKLFLQNNFINVNIKDICNLAGVSRVTFYKHFKSIDELIFEVQIDILNNITDFIISRDDVKASGIERLKMVLNAWIAYAKEYKEQMKFSVLFDLYYDTNEEVNSMYEKFISEESDKDFLHTIVCKGIEDKTLRQDLEPIKTEYYIYQTITGVVQRMSYTRLPIKYVVISFDEIANSVVDMIISYVINSNHNE
ncbi:bacterial regulatory protein, tetR family [Clostridium puniceum]|uniref:Bacterial regulatory protein, tetR family n=1 Tax=Clostridium puniceum TaxID=29367 RepID=A0A1S8T8W3_9CLOT|nr:TetR/AcrR family transcriptional regulator [Clostridium puniceum]OOM74102.1 bacterial regulatory protein, tetR family [Clostridium puniceum]